MPGKLAGKTALVTGASRGIGKATALALAREGANVVINYLASAKAANELVTQIGADRALAVQADTSEVPDIKRLIEETVKKFGKIDVLVANAGLTFEKGALDDIDEESFEKIYKTNVKGPLFLVKEAASHIPSGGRVLLFSTSLTQISAITPNYLLYVSTKGAIEQMTRILAKDLGRRSITVNTISPGPTATEGFYNGKSDEIVERIKSWAPNGRLGTPEDIANAVVLVASPESAWMNGVNFRVNGGVTVG